MVGLMTLGLLCPFSPAASQAQPAPTKTAASSPTPRPGRAGFIDFNGYVDTRHSSVATVNLLANLPARFQYFSLTNVYGPNDSKHLTDLTGLYTEQNLRWMPSTNVPVDLVVQWVIRSGLNNDVLRLGARLRIASFPGLDKGFAAISLNYSVTAFAAQIDFVGAGYPTLLEHAYRWTPLGEPMYVAGFMDHALWFNAPDGASASRIVTEHQVGLRLWGLLYAVCEYRFNQYLAPAQRNGVGFGLEYLLRFKS